MQYCYDGGVIFDTECTRKTVVGRVPPPASMEGSQGSNRLAGSGQETPRTGKDTKGTEENGEGKAKGGKRKGRIPIFPLQALIAINAQSDD